MCELPVHPTVAKMLLGSSDFGCSQEIAVIVAMLQASLVVYRYLPETVRVLFLHCSLGRKFTQPKAKSSSL